MAPADLFLFPKLKLPFRDTRFQLVEEDKRESAVKEHTLTNEPLVDASVGAAAIFSNSAIDLNGVCYLNDKMNTQVKQEAGDFLETEMVDVSRSAPDIKAAASAGTPPEEDERPLSPDAEGLKRRSESEPNLVKAEEHYEETT